MPVPMARQKWRCSASLSEPGFQSWSLSLRILHDRARAIVGDPKVALLIERDLSRHVKASAAAVVGQHYRGRLAAAAGQLAGGEFGEHTGLVIYPRIPSFVERHKVRSFQIGGSDDDGARYIRSEEGRVGKECRFWGSPCT